MAILKLLIILTAVAATLFYSNQPATAHALYTMRAEPADRGSVNPLEIKRLIDESKTKSKRTGVIQSVNLVDTWRKLGIDDRQLEDCGGGTCEAEVSRADLDQKFPKELILKVNNFYFCRFLVFTPNYASSTDNVSWTFRGHVDWEFNRYQMARHRIVQANGRPWLVIRGQAGSGSGFSLYGETLYELGNEGLRAVLSYPVEGQTYPWPQGLGRAFRGRTRTDGEGNLIVLYEVNYEAIEFRDRKTMMLAQNHHQICYTWNKKEHDFRFSTKCSNASEEAVWAIANIETAQDDEGEQIGGTTFYSASETKAFVGGGYDVFLKYNFPVLMKIATSKREEEREWLREFLKGCEGSPKKAELLEALANK